MWCKRGGTTLASERSQNSRTKEVLIMKCPAMQLKTSMEIEMASAHRSTALRLAQLS